MHTTDSLEETFRSDVFDKADVDAGGNSRDTLWSSAEVLRYINAAADRVARDTLGLYRRFEFEVAAEDPLIPCRTDTILDIVAADFVMPAVSSTRALEAFDVHQGIWRDDYGAQIVRRPDLNSVGQPTHFARDSDPRFLRIYPAPLYAGTLTMLACITPQELHPGMPLPFQARADIELMLQWMKQLAYRKQDADVQDLTRADSYLRDYNRDMPSRRAEIDRILRPWGGTIRPR